MAKKTFAVKTDRLDDNLSNFRNRKNIREFKDNPTVEKYDMAVTEIRGSTLSKEEKGILIEEITTKLHKNYENIPDNFDDADKEINELVEIKAHYDTFIGFAIAERLDLIRKYENEEWFKKQYKNITGYINGKITYARETAYKYYNVYKAVGKVVAPGQQLYITKITPFLPIFNEKNNISEKKKDEVRKKIIEIGTSRKISKVEATKIAEDLKNELHIKDHRKKVNKKDPFDIFLKSIQGLGVLTTDQKENLRIQLILLDKRYNLDILK